VVSRTPPHLEYFLTDGHAQAWAEPWSGDVGAEWTTPDLYVAAARELERAGFGTAEQVAAEMEAIMELVGGDGFLLSGPTTRHFLAEIADGLVPALQDRGSVRRTYSGSTLRENMLER
jgi:alkanesulfonate monooxygenase SsuD/methylene tetrahydromethanopterin reductase-like flavin-dependent oxidoreductase (luciferase family)